LEDLGIYLRIWGSILAAVLVGAGCSPRPALRVGVIFDNNWILGPVALGADEQARIRAAAFSTLREAFSGFAVDFAEDASRDRLIRLDRHLLRLGATPIGSKVSNVSLDAVNLTLLTVVGCRDLASCDRRPRAELIDALGRGFGATAAHELGHQAGLLFVRDIDCADCWDGVSAAHRSHFFGGKHWSPAALAMMRYVLPSLP
jgi:hypothetical protein